MLSNGFILQESGITNSHFHNNNLMQTVVNLMFAGTDTTATTLRWGLLFMAKNPKIQGKELKISSIFMQQRARATKCFTTQQLSTDQVQEELSSVIGSRQVQVEDRKNLPFTDAVIHETQRLANILPMSLPHKTSQDITFQGHFIQKVRLNNPPSMEV